jgi:hypothetical protein
MEWLNAYVGTVDSALQQRPEVFHPVRVNMAVNVLLSVIDDLCA